MKSVSRGSGLAAALGTLVVPLLLSACGGGNADNPTAIPVQQCSGSTCTGQGAPASGPVSSVKLCPDALDYTTTFTGGSGSGEYVKVKFDTSRKQYQMTFVESAVPTSAGQVNNSRAGMTINGNFEYPNLYQVAGAGGTSSTPLALPNAEQNRCAFVLKDGATADGTYSVAINPQDPPMLFVGQGIVGGGIPGATIEFDGLFGIGIGAVPLHTFDSYPFIGFSETVTDFSQVAGTYNELGFRITPEGTVEQTKAGVPDGSQLGWQPDAIQTSETFAADGSCHPGATQYSCISTGAPWTLRTNADGTADNVFVSGVNSADGTYPAAGANLLQFVSGAPNGAHGVMIVGKVNNQLVPVVIRVGNVQISADLSTLVIDDQIGISLLAPATTLAPAALTGGYIGANSASACGLITTNGQSSIPYTNPATLITTYPSAGACLDQTTTANPGVNYMATLFQDQAAGLLNPFASSVTSSFSLDYTQTQPGLINVTATKDFLSGTTPIFSAGDKGVMVRVGRVYAVLMNGVNQQFTTYDPANNVSKVNPFLSIGSFVQ